MGASWRIAIVATITLALCALGVVGLDTEDASAVMETSRLRYDGVRGQPYSNNQQLLTSEFLRRGENRERRVPPSLMGASQGAQDLTASQQKSVLAKLAAEKRRLRGILALHRRSQSESREWEERPRRQHRYERSWAPRREVFAEEEVHSQPVRHPLPDPDSEASEALVEHSSAMFRAAMLAEVKQAARDRKRRASIERDEEELEEEQAMAFRAKLHEKDQKNRAQKARLLHRLRQYKRKDRISQQMIKDAEKQATESAAQAAHAAAEQVAGQMEKELMIDVRQHIPQQLSQQVLQGSAAPAAPQTDTGDLITVEPAQATVKQRDPEVKALKGEIASLREALAAKTGAVAQKTEAAPVAAPAVVTPEMATPDATPLIMEDDSTSTAEVSSKAHVQKAAHSAANTAAKKKPKSARVAPQSPQQVAEPAKEPSVVDVVPEKPLDGPVKVDAEPTPSDDEEPVIEGAENEEQAETDLIAYAIWGSVGALVVGIFSTIVYCACQQPRDRPWGMPPKRQF